MKKEKKQNTTGINSVNVRWQSQWSRHLIHSVKTRAERENDDDNDIEWGSTQTALVQVPYIN